jgi:hypothetical protein
MKRIARAMYSNPPVHGARIVAEVVNDEGMFNEWKQARIPDWELLLCCALESLFSHGIWPLRFSS